MISPNFFSVNNFVRIASASSIPVVLTLGATFVILLGSIDLSVEGVMAIAGVVLASLVAADSSWFGSVVGVIAAIAIGAAMGAFSGLLHVVLRIPSFMVTLGMWFIGLGIATLMVGGGTIAIREAAVRGFALERFAGLPFTVWIALVALFVAWVVQNHTRLGRHIYALGGGEDIAVLSGVSVLRTKLFVFAMAGAFYGLGAVLAAAQLGQGNADIGTGRLFTTITAVVVGGTSLLGGQGGVMQSLIGVLIVSVLANGMVLLGIPPYLQQAFLGLMIIGAVAYATRRTRFKIVK
ncbi:ABC transporter permease [Ochrobactrum sp. S46]|nr:ABC transporter permease [Ochrobactrum sp. S45]MBK0045710.1 ABC transporter permease [Ochrobactrum sp. S46]